jgi:predicted secreted protein
VLPAASPTLTAIKPGTTNPAGDAVSSKLISGVTDADASAKKGVAVTAVTGTGKWQYLLAGTTTWKDVGTVSTTAALLLKDTDKLRFVPSAGFAGTATATYRAWDQTKGTAGTKLSVSPSGGSTAFSSGSRTASLLVNTAPTLAAGSKTLTAVPEDSTDPAGQTVSGFASASVTDPDAGAKKGIAVTAKTGSGTWQYQPAGTTTWKNFPAVSASAALLLKDTDKLRFVPAANFNGTATVTYRAWDQTTGTAGGTASVSTSGNATSFSTGAQTASLAVTAVNDAPVLEDGDPELTGVGAGATDPAGDAVSALLDAVFSDADAGALRGIAVVETTGDGTWQWWDGAAWQDVGTVSGSAALLLRDADKLRFVPDAGFTGTATVTYRAWDRTDGSAGSKVDITATGGTTAFSDLLETATLEVVP